MTDKELGIGLYKMRVSLTGSGLWPYLQELMKRRTEYDKEICIMASEGPSADIARGRYQANGSLLDDIENLIDSALTPSEQADDNKEESDA